MRTARGQGPETHEGQYVEIGNTLVAGVSTVHVNEASVHSMKYVSTGTARVQGLEQRECNGAEDSGERGEHVRVSSHSSRASK